MSSAAITIMREALLAFLSFLLLKPLKYQAVVVTKKRLVGQDKSEDSIFLDELHLTSIVQVALWDILAFD